MAGLEVRIDRAALARLESLIRQVGDKAPAALMRAVNHTGPIARTRMRRELVKQTGLKAAVLTKAVKTKTAGIGGVFVISTAGGNIRLKYFAARETASGVSAAPWAHRQVFGGTFIKGGRFPNRVDIGKGGQVFRRTGDSRLPIELVKSGVFIPVEMVRGASEAAFYAVVETDLGPRLEHELLRLL